MKKKNIDKKVIMISSNSNEDEETEEKITIQKKEYFNATYLIATSVIDNGINIKDLAVKNIVIIADTKDEFLQMLGRKRKKENQEKIYLYLWKHNKQHFLNRLHVISRRKRLVEPYYQQLMKKIGTPLQKKQISVDGANILEMKYIRECHNKIMQDLADNKILYEDVASMFYPFNGVYFLSFLSLIHCDNLNMYYKRL